MSYEKVKLKQEVILDKLNTIIIIALSFIFVIISISVFLVLIIYDGLFQRKNDLYYRMGAVLEPQDKEIFAKSRESQVKQYKFWSLVIVISTLVMMSIMVTLLIIEPSHWILNLILSYGTEIYFLILLIVYIRYLTSRSLIPPSLRSFNEILKVKGFSIDIVRNQIPSLKKSDIFLKRDYQILGRSFFKSHKTEFASPHDIPSVRYSMFKRQNNGKLNEDYNPKYKEPLNYLNSNLKSDLKFTKLYQVNRLLVTLFIFGMFGTMISLFTASNSNFESLDRTSFFHSSVVLYLLLFFTMFIFTLFVSSHFTLTNQHVDRILSEHNVEIEDLTLVEKMDKIIELIELKYPYIELESYFSKTMQ